MPTRPSNNPFDDDDGEDGGDDFDVHHQQSPTRLARQQHGRGPRPGATRLPPPPPPRGAGALSPPGVGAQGRHNHRAPAGNNPFDDSFNNSDTHGGGGTSSPFKNAASQSQPRSPLRSRGAAATLGVGSAMAKVGSRFPSSALAMLGVPAPSSKIPKSSAAAMAMSTSNSQSSLPPIFSTRPIMEWPLPSVVKHTLYAKLWLTTQKLHGSGSVRLHVSSGISPTIFSAEESFYALVDASDAAALKYIGNHDNNTSAGAITGRQQQQAQTRKGPDGAGAGSTFTGYLKNFLPVGAGGGAGDASSASSTDKLAALSSMDDAALDALLTNKSARKVYPPAPKCVTCSNGWIVSVMECEASTIPQLGMLNDTSGISTMSSVHHSSSVTTSATGSQPQSSTGVLRLVSRWNVRYQGQGDVVTTHAPAAHKHNPHMSGASRLEETLIPLPPPVVVTDSSVAGHVGYPHAGTIEGVFMDPTGHHVLISAKNGELYHLHSSGRIARRLKGFGPLYQKTSHAHVAASAATSASTRRANLQRGEFVTSVAWDQERGTEGSTKRILLGTSQGRVYEHSITTTVGGAAASADSNTNDHGGAGVAGTGTLAKMDHLGGESNASTLAVNPNLKQPAGLAASGANKSSPPAPVGPVLVMDMATLQQGGDARSNASTGRSGITGLHFERLPGGRIMVLVLTSSSSADDDRTNTSLNTFCSAPNDATLRGAFQIQANATHSSVEIPHNTTDTNRQGEALSSLASSLKICQDGFAFGCGSSESSAGIYCGVINSKHYQQKHGLLLSDTALLPYPQKRGPLKHHKLCFTTSMALTPHHIVTVNNQGIVNFINRVSQQVVQSEHPPQLQPYQGPGGRSRGAPAHQQLQAQSQAMPELCMDPRFPGQLWLRQGRTLLLISSTGVNEDRSVWKYKMEKCMASDKTLSTKKVNAEFDLAKSLCTSKAQKTLVDYVRGEYLLAASASESHGHGQSEAAASYLSQAPPMLSPFSKTSLRLCLPTLRDLMVSYYESNSGDDSSDSAPSYSESGEHDRREMTSAALDTYLTEKLHIGVSTQDSVASAMISAWLVELELHSMKRAIDPHGNRAWKNENKNKVYLESFLSSLISNNTAGTADATGGAAAPQERRNVDDSQTTLQILQSHDVKASSCAAYAAASRDLGSAINAALSARPGKEGAQDALRVLSDMPLEQGEPFFYKYAYALLCRAPWHTCQSLLQNYNTHGLPQPMKLLPSLMAYDSRRQKLKKQKVTIENQDNTSFVADETAVIKYLEGVIKLGCTSAAIYNYLVSLYAELEDEGPLFRFLRDVTSSGTQVTGVGTVGGSPLDVSYALRRILKTGRHFRSAVKLFMDFGLRPQAVELALKVDPALARELAKDKTGLTSKDERKRLWLMIVRNAAADVAASGSGSGSSDNNGKEVVAKVVSVLKDCGPDVLSIEDALPFLPDFAQIDEFKDEICQALTSYSSKIDQYMQEMKECDHTCTLLREEINRLQTHEMQLKTDAVCALSGKRVLDAKEPFYVFPSGYACLETALKQEVLPRLSAKQREQAADIEKQLQSLRMQMESGQALDASTRDHFEQLQAELNGLIAAECPLTGTLMVDGLDAEFATENEDSF